MPRFPSLHRITASGKFIPEIDGLRFVAIVPVVLCHLLALIAVKTTGATDSETFDRTAEFFIRGRFGVQLFFVISGLILGIPFCMKRMKREQDLQLKSYFLRRLTRIEPPYVIVMILLFFANVYIARSLEFNTALKSLFSSLFYSHNFIYGRHVYPLLTTVAWSLEIEIQFYLLVPVLSTIFLIRNNSLRRGIMISSIILFIFLSDLAQFSFLSLYDFIQYFMIGFLLADLYCRREKIKKHPVIALFGYVSLVCIWLYDTEQTFGIWVPIWHLAQIIFVFLFFYAALFQNGFGWLKNEFVVIIGGMCYSIYLLHYPIISFFGNILSGASITGAGSIDHFIYAGLIFLVVLVSSALFFILIERPCMKRDWYRNLFKFRRSGIRPVSE